MPESKTKPAKSGANFLLPKAARPEKPGFDPKQTCRPCVPKNMAGRGGKPMLFPGRTGGR